MRNYQHIRDFTLGGQERFAAFLSACVRSDVSGEACRMDCLGTLEEQLNETPGQPLHWQLGSVNTSSGQALAFEVDRQWLLIEPARIQPSASSHSFCGLSRSASRSTRAVCLRCG